MHKEKTTIGSAEHIDFAGIGVVPARIDTGARTSAIWASRAEVVDDVLEVVFFDKSSPLYDGKVHQYRVFDRLQVASSNGAREIRFVIHLVVRLGGRKVRARFTLANRSTQVYPVLIGRNVLHGKFIVDVSLGQPLIEEERERRHEAKQAGKKAKEQTL